jgi:hypothetical protein
VHETNKMNSCHFTDRANSESNPQGRLLDSGATTHAMASDMNAIDVQDSTGHVLVGNGEKCSSTRLAKGVLEENETGTRIELKNADITPNSEWNIVSMLR